MSNWRKKLQDFTDTLADNTIRLKANKALVEGIRTGDFDGVEKALSAGANPNCKIYVGNFHQTIKSAYYDSGDIEDAVQFGKVYVVPSLYAAITASKSENTDEQVQVSFHNIITKLMLHSKMDRNTVIKADITNGIFVKDDNTASHCWDDSPQYSFHSEYKNEQKFSLKEVLDHYSSVYNNKTKIEGLWNCCEISEPVFRLLGQLNGAVDQLNKIMTNHSCMMNQR